MSALSYLYWFFYLCKLEVRGAGWRSNCKQDLWLKEKRTFSQFKNIVLNNFFDSFPVQKAKQNLKGGRLEPCEFVGPFKTPHTFCKQQIRHAMHSNNSTGFLPVWRYLWECGFSYSSSLPYKITSLYTRCSWKII